MTLEDKIGQLIIAGVDGDVVTPETCRYIEQLRPAGITLGSANMPDPESLRLFTAGLQGIGRDLYEAAELDGCNAWQQFRHVTVPQLRETTFFVTVTTVILALQLFDIVYALNQPNPVGYPNNATLTPVVYIYQLGFQQDSFGRASAVAWVLFVLIFIFTLAQFRMQRAEAEAK